MGSPLPPGSNSPWALEEGVWPLWGHLSVFKMKRFTASVQFSCSVTSNSATPWTAACQASLSISNSQSLLKLMSIESVMPSNHLILCCPLLLLQSFPASGSFLVSQPVHQVARVLEFSFSISPSSEYSGLISFRMDWLDLLVIQGTLKSLLQHHSSKPSILQHLAFFIIQLSHPYMTTGQTIALTRRPCIRGSQPFPIGIIRRE